MYLQIRRIQKTFGQEQVLQDLDLDLEKGKLLSVLGRSGSGKTTLLKILAGLETADAGEVSIDGQNQAGIPPHLRNVVYLYQEPLLFPHLNVQENLAFGLRLRKVDPPTIQRQTRDLLAHLELSDQAQKRPYQLSGGQRQRIAFGRAIIINPKVLLLDEPFGALDTETRGNMQQLLQRTVQEFGITTIFVTHDLKEALLLGDEIAMMQAGRLTKYENKQAFIRDEQTGVQQELQFWQQVQSHKSLQTE